MAKTRKNRSRNILKNITTTSKKTLPVLNNGLLKVGKAAKFAADKSSPIVKKGVSYIYGTLAAGVNLGVKGAKTVAKGVTITKRSRKVNKKSKRRRM